MINTQLAMDFGDVVHPPFALERGKWNHPEHTAADWVRIVDAAGRSVRDLAESLRPLFATGVDMAKAEVAQLLGSGGSYAVSRCKVSGERESTLAFIEMCTTMVLGKLGQNVEVKLRNDLLMSTAALHIEGIGTLIARSWHYAECWAVDYHPWRDPFFFPSYLDQMTISKVPLATWKGAYCADKIACSGTGIASVPTFKFGGREYVQIGGMGYREVEQAKAWSVTPLADWRGETYSYRSVCQAWDDGILERGDERGLVVKVRGQICVLDQPICVYDEKLTAHGVSGTARVAAGNLIDADVLED